MWCLIISFLAVVVEECTFEGGYCGWTSIADKDQWKLTSNGSFLKYPGKVENSGA